MTVTQCVRSCDCVCLRSLAERHCKCKLLAIVVLRGKVVFVARLPFVVLPQWSHIFWFLSSCSLKEDGAGTPYDKESTAIIKLNNTTVLYLKEVTKFLALVCFVREESFERKGNFLCVI